METTPPAVPQTGTNQQDESHLKLLAIFHYVLAGVTFVLGCIPIIHLVLGILMFTQSGPFGAQGIPEFRPQPTPDDVLFDREPGSPGSAPIQFEPNDQFSRNHQEEELKMVGGILATIGGVLVSIAWLLAFLLAFAGRSLQKRKRYIFCMIVAGVSCIHMPMGTTLGIFTILVLMRPTVKQAFGRI